MEELATEFWRGVEEFNRRQFYDCHDTLEAIWMEAMEPQRTFYQGVLQMAVALYHLSQQNWRGAVILLGEGMKRLRPYAPEYGTVDVAALLDQGETLLAELQATGPEATVSLWQHLLKNPQSSPNLPTIRRILPLVNLD